MDLKSIISQIILVVYFLPGMNPPKLSDLHFSLSFVRRPSWKFVCVFSLIVYTFSLSGLVYDAINKPPLYGVQRDAAGRLQFQTVLPYRLNAQYAAEGIYAGMMYTFGGVGLILVYWALSWETKKKNQRYIFFIGGTILFFICYFGLMSFLKIKVPYYLALSDH